jgi:hypothetical protein
MKNVLACLLIAAVAGGVLPGCATTDAPESQAPTPPVSTSPRRDARPPGLGVGQRAQSAVEGMVLGAVIGAQAGPVGAAVGAGTLMLYAAVTGRVPLSSPAAAPRDTRDDEQVREEELEEELDRELDQELDRSDDLERQIEAELERQEKLLDQMRAEREASESPPSRDAAAPVDLASRADPRSAPAAPVDRDLPLAIFAKEERTIERGEWGNDAELRVIVRTLDADEDGNPEQVRYFDAQTGVFLRKEQDRDYDGKLDATSIYEAGALARRELDDDADGDPDVFETYADDRMTSREVDRDRERPFARGGSRERRPCSRAVRTRRTRVVGDGRGGARERRRVGRSVVEMRDTPRGTR